MKDNQMTIKNLADKAGLSLTEDDKSDQAYWLVDALEYSSDRARREPTEFNISALHLVRDFIMHNLGA